VFRKILYFKSVALRASSRVLAIVLSHGGRLLLTCW